MTDSEDIENEMDEIIQDALSRAREVSLKHKQSREDYEYALKTWVEEIRTEISAR